MAELADSLKWHCNRCRVGFRVARPSDGAETCVCPEDGCGKRFWTGTQIKDGGHIAVVGVWPLPEDASEPFADRENLLRAARQLRDVWNASDPVHSDRLYEAITAVRKAITAIDSEGVPREGQIT